MRLGQKTGPRLPVAPSDEQATVKAILQFLHLHHIPAWRMNTGATKIGERFLRFGVTGMSDIVGIDLRCLTIGEGKDQIKRFYGQFLAIEVKAAKGTVTAAQQNFLDQVNAAGGKAFVARSVDDVKRELGL
jgi:hypothetical protein